MFILSYNCVSQRHKVSDGETCPDILQVRSSRAILTMVREVFELLFCRINLQVQFLEVLIVELSRDCFIDILVPEPSILL